MIVRRRGRPPGSRPKALPGCCGTIGNAAACTGFPGSHSIHLDRGKYLTELARFMMGLGFLPPGVTP